MRPLRISRAGGVGAVFFATYVCGPPGAMAFDEKGGNQKRLQRKGGNDGDSTPLVLLPQTEIVETNDA